MRKIRFIPVVLALLALVFAMSPAMATGDDSGVRIVGKDSTHINHFFDSTYHFSPATIEVKTGDTITFVNTGTCNYDCTHTISTASAASLPSNVTQVFSCLIDLPGTVCLSISTALQQQGPVATIPGNPGGIKEGNSFLITPGQSLTLTITAPAGTTIHFICGIHPWMQGTIKVDDD